MRWLGALLLTLLIAPAQAQINGSVSSFAVVSLGTTNSTLISGGPGGHFVYGFSFGNTGSAAWVKFYDKVTAPVCGTDTPVAIFPIPGNSLLAGSNLILPYPANFTNGLGYCITGAAANNDTTTVTIGQVSGTIFWH